MSAGHAHRRPNERHPRELAKLEADPSFHAMITRQSRVDVTKDVPDLAGYSVMGDAYYLDQDFVAALGGGQITVPGMTSDQIRAAVLIHERVEKAALDAENDIRTYQGGHEFATIAEHEFVRRCGAKPYQYEQALAPIIKVCATKPIVNPPLDLDCEPYVDSPDKADRRILKAFKRLGVLDAGKQPKESVDYGPSKGADRCDGCDHFQADQPQELSPCDEVSGAVRGSWWCKLWTAREQEDGETEGGSQEQVAEQRLRDAGRAQVPDAGQESRVEREGAGDTGSEGGADVGVDQGEDRRQGQPQTERVT